RDRCDPTDPTLLVPCQRCSPFWKICPTRSREHLPVCSSWRLSGLRYPHHHLLDRSQMNHLQQEPKVKLLAPSVSSETGINLATFELEYWRSIHSEVMTHRKAAKNARSSRARPNPYAHTTAMRTPWAPEQFGSNKPGMQAGEEDPEARVMLPDYLLAPFK